jgi:TRAP transporter TAXI family solute receptor
VHVLVRADSDLKSIAQLKGKRVGIGVPGSASRTTAVAVLKAHGVALEQLAKAEELSLNEALVALRQNRIDALVQVIGAPADSIRDATTAIPLRLLPLEARPVRELAADSPALFPLTLPRGTYPGQEADVPTVATAAIMVVSGELTDAEVADITRGLFARGGDLVARGSAQGAQISPGKARLGLAVPLHLAAAKVLDTLAPEPAAKPASAP